MSATEQDGPFLTIHFGITNVKPTTKPEDRWLPMGFACHGDSFLVWGEHRQGDREAGDTTLHVIYRTIETSHERAAQTIPGLRRMLEGRTCLLVHERLIDYVCITDSEDWSENSKVWTLEGALS